MISTSSPLLIDQGNAPGQKPPSTETLKHITKHPTTKSRIFVTNLRRPHPMLPNEQPRRRFLPMARRSLIQQIWAAPSANCQLKSENPSVQGNSHTRINTLVTSSTITTDMTQQPNQSPISTFAEAWVKLLPL